ncbi:MAG: phosphatase PAP2 family protein [Bacteroidetes bacterium]|nr:phosphatase PAP2 family protein [Bacteroidota bacterium]
MSFLLTVIFTGSTFPQGFRGINSDTTYSEPRNIDVTLFRAVNNARNGFSNTVVPWSDKSVLPVSVALPLGFAGLSRANKNYYDENSAVLLGVSEITSVAFTAGIKYLIKRERPYAELRNVYSDKNNSPTDRYSFPSGHTAMAFSIATSLTLRYPDKPAVIAGSFLYAALVGYGRIYLGVHYPSDILGGMLVGAGSAALVYSLRKEIIKEKNNLFGEKNRRDSNNETVSAPLILGLTIGADLVNEVIRHLAGNRLFVTADSQSLSIKFNL